MYNSLSKLMISIPLLSYGSYPAVKQSYIVLVKYLEESLR